MFAYGRHTSLHTLSRILPGTCFCFFRLGKSTLWTHTCINANRFVRIVSQDWVRSVRASDLTPWQSMAQLTTAWDFVYNAGTARQNASPISGQIIAATVGSESSRVCVCMSECLFACIAGLVSHCAAQNNSVYSWCNAAPSSCSYSSPITADKTDTTVRHTGPAGSTTIVAVGINWKLFCGQTLTHKN